RCRSAICADLSRIWMDKALVVMDNAVVQDAKTTTRKPDDQYLRGPRGSPAGDAAVGCPRRSAVAADGDRGRDRSVVGHAPPGSVDDDALLRAPAREVADGVAVRG